MVGRRRDVLDHLCGSMEIFMCGSDFNRNKAGTPASEDAENESLVEELPPDETPSNNNPNNSDAKALKKKVAIVAPMDDEIGVEKDPVAVSIRVTTPRQPTYLELVSYYEKGGVYIKTIHPKSKFYGTKVEAGMKIIRINGQQCPGSVKETFDLINSITEVITLTAVTIESEYGEDDFMFREIKLDDDDGKNLRVEEEEEKEEKNAPSPTRVTTGWFNGILGGDKKEEKEDQEKKAEERKERIKNSKEDAVKTSKSERDRIGLGFADKVLMDLGVIEQDGEDNDSFYTYDVDDTTLQSAPTLDDTTYISAPMDDDEYTMSTTGGTTIVNHAPIISKIYKKTKQDPLGLHFVSFKKKRGIYVYRIHEESRFLSTKLEPGMKLLAINGKPCPATVAETLALVQNVEGDLSVEAHFPSPEDLLRDQIRQQEPPKLPPTSAPVPATIGVAEKVEEEKKEDDGDEKKDTAIDDVMAQIDAFSDNVTDVMEDDDNKEALPPPTSTEA